MYGNINAIINEEKLTGTISSSNQLNGTLSNATSLSGALNNGLGTPTTNYERLINLPQVNDVTLIGNKSFSDLGIETLTNLEIEELINSQI